MKTAVFAGGCFWCMVKPFNEWPGIEKIEVGYTGGRTEYPTYEEVCQKTTGHVEAVEITYDPLVVSYEELLEIFFRSIDPTDAEGQFGDRGESYRPVVFYETEEERQLAESYIKKINESGWYENPVVVPVEKRATFYPAEAYHQEYYKKNPLHYKRYYKGSGRKDYIEAAYGKRYDAETLRTQLSEEAYHVTQENGTEPPYHNVYDAHFEEGIYVDVITGKPLFASTDKYQSGCGWPAFTKPIIEGTVYDKEDKSHGMVRVEIRSSTSDAHLGHVFTDGPPEAGGLRYCINSAALRFVPKEDMDVLGYGNYKKFLEKSGQI